MPKIDLKIQQVTKCLNGRDFATAKIRLDELETLLRQHTADTTIKVPQSTMLAYTLAVLDVVVAL